MRRSSLSMLDDLRAVKTRREVLEMLGVGAGLALAYPFLGSGAASALIAEAPIFPGQVGSALSYVTPKGTACWMFYAYAGTEGNPRDDYHYAKIIVPKRLDVSVPTPTVLVVHGATASEECITKPGGGAVVAQSWLDLGWPVIATREGSVVTKANGTGSAGKWGNELSRRGMADAWRWAQTAWTPDPRGFLVLGASMGGIGALNFAAEARRQRLPIGAVYIVDGTTNLAYCDMHTKGFHNNIKVAYGLPKVYVAGDGNWRAKIDGADGGHDPQKFVPGLLSFPLRFSASSNDPTVNKANNSALLYNALLAARWTSELGFLNYAGAHEAKAHFKPTDINPFFQRAMQRTNQAPHAVFTFAVTETLVVFDASGSFDSDGYVVDYAWDFGDGNTGSGASIEHDFIDSGTYAVTLTVTDDIGATGTNIVSIAVTAPAAPNSPPTAAFSFAVTGTVVDFDASASGDVDGSIVAFDWDFGDGNADSGVTVEHDFGGSGSFDVALTVTDDSGAQNVVTQTVDIPAVDTP